jgi:hypothetical protein
MLRNRDLPQYTSIKIIQKLQSTKKEINRLADYKQCLDVIQESEGA